MIPQTKMIDLENTNFISSRTSYINFDKEVLQGEVNELDAVKQAIYMILNTEKESYNIYPLDYGISLEKYIGMPYDYIVGSIGTEIKEALMKDERILDVTNFSYEEQGENILIKFVVETVYGEVSKEVLI